MGRGFVVVVLLGGCGPRVEEVCVEVEWVRALEDAVQPCDVAVRSDGTIGVLTRDAVIEIDAHGEAVGSRGLTAPDRGAFRWCRTIVADRRDRWWVTVTASVGPRDLATWISRLDPGGTAEAKLHPGRAT